MKWTFFAIFLGVKKRRANMLTNKGGIPMSHKKNNKAPKTDTPVNGTAAAPANNGTAAK